MIWSKILMHIDTPECKSPRFPSLLNIDLWCQQCTFVKKNIVSTANGSVRGVPLEVSTITDRRTTNYANEWIEFYRYRLYSFLPLLTFFAEKKSFFEEKRILFFVQNFRGVSTEENLHFGDSVQQNSFPAPWKKGLGPWLSSKLHVASPKHRFFLYLVRVSETMTMCDLWQMSFSLDDYSLSIPYFLHLSPPPSN